MRSLRSAAALTLLLVPAPPAAARPVAQPVQPPVAVLVSVAVSEGATALLPAPAWRTLVVTSIVARPSIADEETTIADDARCRAAHAVYAVLATLNPAVRLPGLAQDPDRSYAVARFAVRNCVTGEARVSVATLRLESDPPPPAQSGTDGNPAARWERPVRAALAAHPLVPPLVRVASVRHGTVFLERGVRLAPETRLRAIANAQGRPRATYELVVRDVSSSGVRAALVGTGDPHPGDALEIQGLER